MQHMAAMKRPKHVLTILLLAVSVRGFINIQETCTDDYCEDVIERHEAEKYYSEEEKEEIISSDTNINEQAVDGDTEDADMYEQAVDDDMEDADINEQTVDDDTEDADIYEQAVDDDTEDADIYEQAVDDDTEDADIYEQAVDDDTEDADIYEQAVDDDTEDADIYEQAVDGDTEDADIYEQTVDDDTEDADIYEQAVDDDTEYADIYEQTVDDDTQDADIYEHAVDADMEDAVEIDTNVESLETLDIDDEIGIDKSWEFPTLHRIDPGNVGDEVQLELEPGHFYTRITKAIKPPIFVIPSFLSDEECDYIIQSAINNGLNISNLFSAEIADEFSDSERDKSDISRISEQTWLSKSNLGAEFWTRLHSRVSKLTELPEFVLKSSEPIQVVSYAPGGHYHAHLDTTNHAYDRPCCIQKRCGEKEFTAEWSECCRLCRFITVLYYLNDVEEGGETAFPIADMSDELVDEKFVNLREQEWYNLSRYCQNSSLIVKPKRGMAVMWYSHYVDNETGHLGKVDIHSHHGGCDLIKGTKWIANNWISGVPFEHRYTQSQWYNTN